MPKKMGLNSKAEEAKERKATIKKENIQKAAKAAEDELWKDDDKNLAKKKAKKEEEEKKRAEQLRKKAEAKALLEQEVASIKVGAKPSIQKITQAQIQNEIAKRNKVIETINAPPKPESRVVVMDPLEENINHLMQDTEVASNIDDAISVLKLKDDTEIDKHPEKRMKAAYKSFVNENLPRIKQEYPSMRMSQWKQILFKEWAKAPQNPFNSEV